MNRTFITAVVAAAVAVVALPISASSATGKPAIGRAVATPAQATAGSAFSVAARVTNAGVKPTVGCTVTAGTKSLARTQSFKGGVAHCSFTVPATATSLKVTFSVASGGQTVRKTFTFAVHPAPKPTLSIADVSQLEGNAGTTTLSFPVSLSKASKQSVSVSWSTANGSATAPADFAAANGTLTFAPGETVKSIAVSVVADLVIEQDETFTVTLSSPVNATIAAGSATGTIRNDDTQVPVTAGSYKGQLPSGDFLYFEVTPARQVSYFRLNDLRENCSPGGYFEGSVAYDTTSLWPISASGDAGALSNWTGTEDEGGGLVYTHYEYRTTVKFDGSENVKGTIQLKDEFDYQGTHFACDTGVVPWTASRVG